MKLPFVAEIVDINGKHTPKIRDRQHFDTYIKRTHKVGDLVWVSVERPAKESTHRQYRYLFGAVYPLLADYMGTSIEMADGIMCRRLLLQNPDSPLEYVKSKSSLTRQELAQFIDGVRQEAADCGIETPDPPERRSNG